MLEVAAPPCPEAAEPRCPQCGAVYPPEARFCPLDGSRLGIEPRDALVGQLIGGQIRVEARLGEGGMGVVYRARQLGLDRLVAVKVLHRFVGLDPEARRRFEREARIGARLDHPNVVRVHLYGHLPDGAPFLVMEHVAGRTLEAILAGEGALPVDRALGLLRPIASGVGAAHAAGIVHRDLKPENVLVASSGPEPWRVKVLDFGVARMLDGAGEHTRSGVIVGTARYISPEGALGERVDPRADVYALGVLAFRMLSGRLPFEAPSSVALLLAHAYEPPPELEAPPGAPRLPEPLVRVVMRALAKRPDDRFADAEAFGQALDRAVTRGAAPSDAPLPRIDREHRGAPARPSPPGCP